VRPMQMHTAPNVLLLQLLSKDKYSCLFRYIADDVNSAVSFLTDFPRNSTL
jgi:hypothetical protein